MEHAGGKDFRGYKIAIMIKHGEKDDTGEQKKAPNINALLRCSFFLLHTNLLS